MCVNRRRQKSLLARFFGDKMDWPVFLSDPGIEIDDGESELDGNLKEREIVDGGTSYTSEHRDPLDHLESVILLEFRTGGLITLQYSDVLGDISQHIGILTLAMIYLEFNCNFCK